MYTKEEYVRALSIVLPALSQQQRHALSLLYEEREQGMTATELAHALGYSHYAPANACYAGIGRRLAETIGKMPEQRRDGTFQWWRVLVPGGKKGQQGHWLLVIYPKLAAAMEELGFVSQNEGASEEGVNCGELLADFAVEVDARMPPDDARKIRFRSGWKDVTVYGRTYSEETLKRLTWQNLGYRLGRRLGAKGIGAIDYCFEAFARHYFETRLVESTGGFLPEEIPSSETFREGAVRQITVNAYERNIVARERCKAHFGARCAVCGFDFGRTYGDLVEGFVHVHHLRQLSEIGEEYEVDPVEDMRPVCPNCHAVIHQRFPPFTIEEVQAMLNRRNMTPSTQATFPEE